MAKYLFKKRAGVQHIPAHSFHMADAPGFAVSLQHSSMHSTHILCKLLCVSKAVSSVVLQQCVGQLPLYFSLQDGWEMFTSGLRGKRVKQLPYHTAVKDTDTLKHLGSWIAKYGRIMKSLIVHNTLSGAMQPLIAVPIATSLLEAARTGMPLQLQSLELRCNDAIGLILTQLSPHHLTQLDIHWESMITINKYNLQSLSQLTGLRQLSVSRSQGKGADSVKGFLDPVISALVPLTNLTTLKLKSALLDWQLLQQLPQQLQELVLQLPQELLQSTVLGASNTISKSTASSVLTVFNPALQATATLQLDHLTALSSLALTGRYSLNCTDTLPVDLKVLRVYDCTSCQPLVSLQQLRQLSMNCSSTPPQELQQLSALGTLSHISLTYVDRGEHDYVAFLTAASYAWVKLLSPRSLNLRTCFGDENKQAFFKEFSAPLQTAVLHNIGRLSNLSELCISNKSLLLNEAAAEFAATLFQLTALTTLELHYLYVCDDMVVPPLIYRFPMSHVLLGSILELPVLSRLSLSSFDMDTTVAATASLCAFSGTVRLTSLFLHDCELTDCFVQVLLAKLGGLQDLTLSCNKGVTGASALAIAQLTQLTSLHLRMANMQLEEIQCLTCLRNLVICDLPGGAKCWWMSSA